LASQESENLSIPLSALREGVSVFTFRSSFTDNTVSEGVLFKECVEIKVQITSVQEDYLFSVEVKGEGEFTCDRCGAPFIRSVEGSVQTLYTFDPLKMQGDYTGDVNLITPEASAIDFAQDAKDALLLSIPGKRVCRASCAGLCPGCGSNLNESKCSCSENRIDPRWEGLKQFTSGESES
jgi:uncharacterized protein